MIASPAAMKELIHYFEKHGQRLDRQDPSDDLSFFPGAADTNAKFVSCIRFNGIPILPPVMTNSRREELKHDRHSAVLKEKCLRVRQRKYLMERASSLVENVDVLAPEPSSSDAARLAGRTSATASSFRLALERPPVLKPVVTSAWASLSASNAAATSAHSVDPEGTLGASSMSNTFATAEQAQLATEDFGLQTLDSVCSELLSLEDTLPTDFHGVPLTTVKQQKISYDLTRLSRVLGVRDFYSTGGSDVSELPSDSTGGEALEKTGATSTLDNVSVSFCRESQDTVVEVGGEHDTSTDASPSSGSVNMSVMSSANTTGTTDSHRSSNRSSPRSFKSNTVHFASFVTEYIDTSASLSSENITVVKKKMPNESNTIAARDGVDQQSEDRNLLSNVSLTDSVETPITQAAPISFRPILPFQAYSKPSDTSSSSNKENDARQANRISNNGNSTSSSGIRPPYTVAEGQPGVTDSQGSSRSIATSESSNSTLIEDAAVVADRKESSRSLPPNIVGEDSSLTNDTDKTPSCAQAGRKAKMLPAEPVVASHVNRPSGTGVKSQEGAAVHKNHSRTVQSRSIGHVRRGSYTLTEPSPALVRAQVVTGVGASGGEEAEANKMYDDSEDHTKPLNVVSLQPVVPSDPESMGKAEHINKYLSQVQLHNSEDVTASQATSVDRNQFQQAAASQLQQSFSILQSLHSSQGSIGSAGSGEEVLQRFQTLQQTLLEQQQRELEEMFVQQRREQMMLQAEFEEHQIRMREQQEFLAANAPENLKIKSNSQEGELSPDYNSADHEMGAKAFTFPAPKTTMVSSRVDKAHGGCGLHPDGGMVLLNSSALSNSPKVHKPVLRSPVKFYPGKCFTGRVVVPPQAYEPEMLVKFDKLSAAVKGFLCRCLLHSDKVQELVKTVKDTREFAFSFQSETPIRKGTFSYQDRTLLERIVAQLQAALLDIHDIFFDTSVPEQMALIEQTRLNRREKMLKSSTDDSVRSSTPRISLATLKAQERRRRAQEAENALFGSSSSLLSTAASRMHSKLSSSGSPKAQSSVDLSGPLKRHYQSLLSKAMKPVAMAAYHAQDGTLLQGMFTSSRLDSSRSEKMRPQSVPDKVMSSRPKKPANASGTSAGTSTHSADNTQPKLNIRPKQLPQQPSHQQPASHVLYSGNMGNISNKSATASSKPIKTSAKTWR